MDVLSSTTAIFATLEVALKVIKYIRAVAGAKEARLKLLQELAQVRGLLLTLQDLSDDTASEVWSVALHDPNGPMAMFKVLVKEMQHIIEEQDPSILQGPALAQEPADQSLSERTKQKLHSLATRLKDVKWPYTESKVTELLNTLERIKSALLLALSNDSIQLNKLLRSELADMHDEVRVVSVGVGNLETSLKVVNEVTTRTNRQTNELLLYAKGDEAWTKERERLFKSISSIDMSFRPSRVSIDGIQKSGSWLLSHATFQEWLANGGSLVLTGLAGTGKSTVTKAVESFLRTSDDSCVVVVDFDKRNDIIPNVQDIFANIVKRMIEEKRSFQKYYNKLMLTGTGSLELNDSLRIIHRARQDFQHFYLILEGLDAYETSAAQDLLGILKNMRTPLTVFATTRPGEINKSFTFVVNNESLSSITDDLKSFIRRRLEELQDSFQDPADESKMTTITDKVFERAGNLFFGARLIVEGLSVATTWEEVDEILEKGQSPKDIIEQMFSSISDQDSPRARLGIRIMRLLAEQGDGCPTGHLLIVAEETEPDLLKSAVDTDKRLDLCVGCCKQLVIRSDDHIRFLHSSVREYMYELHPEWHQSYMARERQQNRRELLRRKFGYDWE